jgi:F-type H+-transporting ATPase subunit b
MFPSLRSRRTLAILAIVIAMTAGVPVARVHAATSDAVLMQSTPMTVAAREAAAGSAQEKAPEAKSAEGAEQQAEANDSWWPAIAKTFNFAVLIGILVYYLRKPISGYLQGRRDTIRKDLVDAATLRSTAEKQLAGVRAKLAQLPAELEALTRRGQEELAAEAVRMKDATAREREKLIDRTHREIDAQSRLARRALVEHTAELAMKLARERVERDITPADQDRLIDRYASGVGA